MITPPLPVAAHSPTPGRRAWGTVGGELSPLVQEAARTIEHGSPGSVYHVPRTMLGNTGAGDGAMQDHRTRQGRSVLFTHIELALDLGGRGLVLLGVPAWPCWHCPQPGGEEGSQFAYIPLH